MEFAQAWEILDKALSTGTMAAHGAGLLTRHDVGAINEAQQAVADHVNALDEANKRFVEHFNNQHAPEADKPCECEDEEDA